MKLLTKVLAVFAALLLTAAMASCTSRNDSATPGSGGSGASSQKLKVAFVPKLQGVPYFEVMNRGGQKAADELGFEWLYQGPTTADAAAQADIVRSFIQQNVNVLIVAPNDPDSMAPLLKEAADKGIKVATSDTDAPNSVRQVFVNQATAEGLGETITDTLMKAMGEKGKFAIVSCGETAANLNSWIDVIKNYAPQKYPNAELTKVVYSGEDQAKGTSMATDLMNSDPQLTGLIGICTTSAPAVAQAVKDADKIGKVHTVGLGTPKSMVGYLNDGSSSGSILWDVENLGYLTGWAGFQLGSGKELQTTNNVNAKMSAVKYDSATKMLLLGDPTVFTKDNAGEYDY